MIPFENLPEESKVWIYQSNRKFSEEEVVQISEETSKFIENWSAHGNLLQASFQIRYNRFIILGVDNEFQNPTGCSIDASVQFIQSLEQKYQIDLLDKMNVSFKQGDFITHKTLLEFKQLAKNKSVSENTIVFNNLVNTVQEFNENWEVPAVDSWHGRFF